MLVLGDRKVCVKSVNFSATQSQHHQAASWKHRFRIGRPAELEVDHQSSRIDDSAQSSCRAGALPTGSEPSSHWRRGKNVGTGDLPRTPIFTTTFSDVCSSLQGTPLFVELAKMPNRRGGLLNKYFANYDPCFSVRPEISATQDEDICPSTGRRTSIPTSPISPT